MPRTQAFSNPNPLCITTQAEMQHIIFGGSFIREHPYTIATISAAVRFFSHGQIQPLFLKHDCFVGAIGAHLQGRPAATHMATQSASPADASPSAPAVQTA
jgi:type II pantothenate kinase